MTRAIDCHCHIQDVRFDEDRAAVLQSSQNQGLRYFLLAGVGPEDWRRQAQVQKEFPFCLPSYGLHPYWVSAHSASECESAMAELLEWVPQGLALGECGLDYRSQIVGEGRAQQREFFQRQLQLAQSFRKVAILHVVRAHDEARVLLQEHSLPRGAILHSFHGDKHRARQYLKLGCYLSVGTMALDPRQTALEEAMRFCPLDRLLVESDAPDQPPWDQRGQRNEPRIVLDLLARIAQIKGIDRQDVSAQIEANLKTLFSKEWPHDH